MRRLSFQRAEMQASKLQKHAKISSKKQAQSKAGQNKAQATTYSIDTNRYCNPPAILPHLSSVVRNVYACGDCVQHHAATCAQ
jgi:hypothetical protein